MTQTQVGISLPKPAIERLDEVAKQEGMSRSAYARLVLLNHLRQEGREDEWSSRL